MRHPLYMIWNGIWQRCTNPNSEYYQDYGGRGITVSDEWKSIEVFAADMGERPPGFTIERINNNLGYCKSNCKWATRQEQARNRRSSRLVTHNGRTQTMIAWAEELGIPYMTLYLRLYRRKIPVAEALIPGKPPTKRIGEANNKAKLTASQVVGVRLDYANHIGTLKHIADKYGVTVGAVWGIIKGRTWKHVA